MSSNLIRTGIIAALGLFCQSGFAQCHQEKRPDGTIVSVGCDNPPACVYDKHGKLIGCVGLVKPKASRITAAFSARLDGDVVLWKRENG